MQTHNTQVSFLRSRALVIAAIVLAAAVLRIAPHPMNFAPIGALALFSGAYFASKRAAFAIPLLSLIAGDIFVGFHRLTLYVYLGFLVSVLLGFFLRGRRSAPRIAVATIAGIPYFWSTLAGDALYVGLLFGGMALAESRFPALRETTLSADAA